MTAVSYTMPEAKGGEMKIMEAKRGVIADLRHFWATVNSLIDSHRDIYI